MPNAVLAGRARSAIVALVEILRRDGKKYSVVLPENICPAVATSIKAAGGRIVPVAVSPKTGLPSDEDYLEKINNIDGDGMFMPTYLYGFFAQYPKSIKQAKKRAWFVLENDTSATCSNLVGSANALARGCDGLLVSFGYAKPVEFGVGGAILLHDVDLAKEIAARIATYPIIDPVAETLEEECMLARRKFRQAGDENISVKLTEVITQEENLTRFSLSPEQSNALLETLSGMGALTKQRLELLNLWDGALAPLNSALLPVALPQPMPWRVIRVVENNRNKYANALREAGFDAGVNYPSLWGQVPEGYLTGEKPDSDPWGDTVLNLWLSNDYNAERINQAAAILQKVMDDE